MKKYLLGLDVGTSGLKALLTDNTGVILATDTQEYPLESPRPGWTQQNPEDWWQGCVRAIRNVLLKSKIDSGEIAGIGFSGQMHGMVALDADGAVVRPAMLWNDNRTTKQCADITALAGGPEGLLKLTNNYMLTGYTGGKILWMRESEPENFAKTVVIINPKDYIRYRLTGVTATDVSDASGTGFYNAIHRAWSEELLHLAGLSPTLFAPVFESHEICGHVTEAVANETGLTAGTPATAGGGDAVIQTTGTGLIRPGVLGVVIGTSGVVAMGLDKPFLNDGSLQFFCGNAPHLWTAFGSTLSAGGSYRWFRDVFCAEQKRLAKESGEDVYDIIGRAAEAAGPGAKGALFLPWISGERCPYPDPNARGAFLGLELNQDFGAMARAVLEGITFSLRQIADILKSTGKIEMEKIIVSGGGALSPLWRQIMADIFELPVVTVSGAGEGGAYGGALVAGVGVGIFANIDDALSVLREETTTLPNLANFETYRRMYSIYSNAYAALRHMNNQLADAWA